MAGSQPVFKGMDTESLMQAAIDITRVGLAGGQSPFGCVIARDGEYLSTAHNTVVATTDITAHAEVNAIRQANTFTNSIHLEGAFVATTCEPCPMCMAALHWARVDTVYFGASIADANNAGFRELKLPAAELLRQGGSSTKLVGGVLAEECKGLFDEWLSRKDRVPY